MTQLTKRSVSTNVLLVVALNFLLHDTTAVDAAVSILLFRLNKRTSDKEFL